MWEVFDLGLVEVEGLDLWGHFADISCDEIVWTLTVIIITNLMTSL